MPGPLWSTAGVLTSVSGAFARRQGRYLGPVTASEGTAMTKQGEEIIRLNGVYKIFGPRPNGRAFELCEQGYGKN